MMRSLALFVAMLLGCGGHKSEVTELAKEAATVTDLTADEGGVAWLASGKDGVELKLLQNHGKPIVVAKGLLFRVALDHDHVFWSDGQGIWRSPRDKVAADRIVDLDDIASTLALDEGYLYWTTPTKAGRIALSGGAAEDVATAPEGGRLERIAVDVGHVVASVAVGKSTELWELDGQPHELGKYPQDTVNLFLDGDKVLWSRHSSSSETLITGLDGHEIAVIAGAAIDATGGTVYVERDDGTYAVSGGKTKKLGPRTTQAKVVNGTLYGKFEESGNVIGTIPTSR
ncbi:MAG: hypothetical protein ABI591_10915 [Kofleriaceae bacterium]